MNETPKNSNWIVKFRNAFRGVWVGAQGGKTNSFWIHIPVAIAVILLGIVRETSSSDFALLLICIGVVLAAEYFNSAVERLAKSITSSDDENIRDALDIASGAVLVVAIFSAVVGIMVLF